MIRSTACLAALMLAAYSLSAAAQEGVIVRHPIPGSDFPIAQAVEIPPGATRVLLSGTVPAPAEGATDPNSPSAYGNTEAQTLSVLKQIEGKLQALGLSMGDVVKMQVYLVAPSDQEPMDFAGFMKGYGQFFGTAAQKNLPVRSVFEVAGLVEPAWLVEIEVEAVRQ